MASGKVFRSIAIASIFLTTLAGGLFTWPAHGLAAERWTSLDGSRTVEADFIGLWGNTVVLELPGQRRVSVDLDDLIAESRIQARRMGEQQQQQRSETIEQIQMDATEAAAPAPASLPRPADAPAYQQPSGNDALLSRLEWFDRQCAGGHFLLACYDAMPASQQSDLEQVVQKSVGKLDRATASSFLNALHSVGEMIVTRQRWLFSHPRFEAMQPDSADKFRQLLLAVGWLLREGLDPDSMKLTDLQSKPLRPWLADLDARLAPHLVALSELTRDAGAPEISYEVMEEKDGEASVQFTIGEQQQLLNFVTVDGAWVPADLLAPEVWTETVKGWNETLESMPDQSLMSGTQFAGVAQTVDPLVQPAMQAETARDFHAAMDGWFQPAQLAVELASGMMNLGFGRGRNNPYGMDGMDSYEQEMMEMEMDMQEGMEDYDSGMRRPTRPQ
ncbi:hypothetical protein FYK55_24630 [Roseiconus nitratireducens]|uniref:Uncharacterized protein n=1 Tax=Roseiconus nitratireducens TaxID=2605748 RepID=A0A5M6CVL7_9BACT|nr:hypothetical protein [Roseiconus nitratireducens]KAA5539298.1 hypothetical protein FYK55_24630 [Roseiconus nitratireducens]